MSTYVTCQETDCRWKFQITDEDDVDAWTKEANDAALHHMEEVHHRRPEDDPDDSPFEVSEGWVG